VEAIRKFGYSSPILKLLSVVNAEGIAGFHGIVAGGNP
jgi:hypothetical protein